MKKILGLALMMTLLASAAQASDKKIEFGIAGGVAIAETGWDLGFGGEVNVGFIINKYFSVLGVVDVHSFTATGSTSTDGISDLMIGLVPTVKYTAVPTGSVQPYVLGGIGATLDMVTIKSTGNPDLTGSDIYPIFVGGAGLDFDLGGSTTLFVQAKAEIELINSSTFTFIPIQAGASF
jgi:hypothetical protein